MVEWLQLSMVLNPWCHPSAILVDRGSRMRRHHVDSMMELRRRGGGGGGGGGICEIGITDVFLEGREITITNEYFEQLW